MTEKFLESFNFKKQCEQYGISLWQCPSFIFLSVGLLNCASLITAYFVGQKYNQSPELLISIITALSIFLFILGHGLSSGFRKIAETNKSKIEFVSIASHQLKTPLSSIRWLLGLILKDQENLSTDTLSYLNDIRSSNERLIKLVNDLLNVNRIETGELSFNPKEVDLITAIQENIAQFLNLITASNIKINFDYPPEAKVWCDPEKLNLVLQNLIENAVKYTKKDSQKHQINIQIENEEDKWKVSIKDQGVGIPKQDQPFVFEKFFRSNNALRQQTIGTGLGLYLVKSIIKIAKGKVGFSSQEKEGSTFWFTLPKAKE